VLQFDYTGEYKDQQFGQNNGIGIHIIVEKYKVDREMNRFLLEKGLVFVV